VTAGPPGSGPRPVVAALLAGGKGTRFWPASRAATPKQFLELLGDRSLLRGTFDRFARLLPRERILIVTSPAYAARTREALPALAPENLVLEPSARDTAPAAALAVQAAALRHEDPIVVLAPTDHLIEDEEAFGRALKEAIAAAEEGSLVTLGVVPDRPATVYGYIEVADRSSGEIRALPVLRFREKPDPETAAEFVASGRFFWNAGIFAWRASSFRSALAEADPSLAAALDALAPTGPETAAGGRPARPGGIDGEGVPRGAGIDAARAGFERGWAALPAVSIDYALMEKARNVKVVPLDAGWTDLGSWDAVTERLPADEHGNRAAQDVLYAGASRCAVHRSGSRAGRRFIALAGTEGLIVVETDDALLICTEGAGERMREIVGRLREIGREDRL
jgi:mannose-1-phosphate guanylyltransferase